MHIALPPQQHWLSPAAPPKQPSFPPQQALSPAASSEQPPVPPAALPPLSTRLAARWRPVRITKRTAPQRRAMLAGPLAANDVARLTLSKSFSISRSRVSMTGCFAPNRVHIRRSHSYSARCIVTAESALLKWRRQGACYQTFTTTGRGGAAARKPNVLPYYSHRQQKRR